MPKIWVKDIESNTGFTYKKIRIKKRDYWTNPSKLFDIIFQPNLIKRGFYNDDS